MPKLTFLKVRMKSLKALLFIFSFVGIFSISSSFVFAGHTVIALNVTNSSATVVGAAASGVTLTASLESKNNSADLSGAFLNRIDVIFPSTWSTSVLTSVTCPSNWTPTVTNTSRNVSCAAGTVKNGTFTITMNGVGIPTTPETSTFTIYAQHNATSPGTAQSNTTTMTVFSAQVTAAGNISFVDTSGIVQNPTNATGAPPKAILNFTSQTPGFCRNASASWVTTESGYSVNINQSCKYVVDLWILDSILGVTGKSGLILSGLNVSNALTFNASLIPITNFNGSKPASNAAILGGFLWNVTNSSALSSGYSPPSYDSINVTIYRRGLMPEFIYRCNIGTFRDMNHSSRYCSTWGSTVATDAAFINTSYMRVNLTTVQDGLFFGENLYNSRPLVKGVANEGNIVGVTLERWSDKQSQYQAWVPLMRFNSTSRMPYIASSGYVEAMFFEKSPLENNTHQELQVWNLTLQINHTTRNGSAYANISIEPHYLQGITGNETKWMFAWTFTGSFNFGGKNRSVTILRPSHEQIYFKYNGTECGPYNNQSIIDFASAAPVEFANSSLTFPCNTTIALNARDTIFNISLPSAVDANFSILLSNGGFLDPLTGGNLYSPIFLANQTFTGGGFMPESRLNPPKPGDSNTINFFISVNNSLRNYSAVGADKILRFMYPINLTVWQGVPFGNVNMSVSLGSNFQLWRANNTNAGGLYNWTLIANSTHVLANFTNSSAGGGSYTTLIPGTNSTYVSTFLGDFSINRSTSNFTFEDNFPGSPVSGRNVTMFFQIFDFNLTTVNSWNPGETASNVTLNLTATLIPNITSETNVGGGVRGSTTVYNATIVTPSAGEVDMTDKLPGFANADLTSIKVFIDGTETNRFRNGSLIVTLDQAGYHVVSIQYAVTAAAATTPSGGGGVSVATTPGKSEFIFTSVPAYGTKIVDLSAGGTGFTELQLSVKERLLKVKLTFEKLADRPSDVSSPAASVFRYIKVTTENIPDDKIDKAKIKFKVDKSWVTNNSIDVNTIALERYENGVWNKLVTKKVSEDATSYSFEADLPGFSVFAITGSKPEVTTTTTTTTPPPVTETPTTTTTPVPTYQPPQLNRNLVLVIVVVIILIIIALVVKRIKI